MTKLNNLIVTLSDTRQIKEYTPDGDLVQEISLNSSVVHPWHSVQLSGDRFVVSHGSGQTSHRVCSIKTDGNVATCNNGRDVSDVSMLSSPVNMAVDSYNNVLVANFDYNKVVLLNPLLKQVGHVKLPSQIFRSPRAIHLDIRDRRFYIGENLPTGGVFVLTAV